MEHPGLTFQQMKELSQLTLKNSIVGSMVNNYKLGYGIILNHDLHDGQESLEKIKVFWFNTKREQWCFWSAVTHEFRAGFWGTIWLVNNG